MLISLLSVNTFLEFLEEETARREQALQKKLNSYLKELEKQLRGFLWNTQPDTHYSPSELLYHILKQGNNKECVSCSEDRGKTVIETLIHILNKTQNRL